MDILIYASRFVEIAVTVTAVTLAVKAPRRLLRRTGTRVAPANPDAANDPALTPAVVSLFAHRFEVTPDAPRATLLDLTARGFTELRTFGPDPTQAMIRVTAVNPDGLEAHERMVYDRILELGGGGPIPLGALPFGDRDSHATWWQALRDEILEAGEYHGVIANRFSGGQWIGVIVASMVAAPVIVLIAGLAVMIPIWLAVHSPYGLFLILGTIVSPLLVFGSWVRGDVIRLRRPTGRGRLAAARWLSQAEAMRADGLDRLAPGAAVPGDRRLAYAVALGLAPACRAAIDFGRRERGRVWASYGGRWRQVRVRYPRRWYPYMAWLVWSGIGGLYGIALLAWFLVLTSDRWRTTPGPFGWLTASALAALAVTLTGLLIGRRLRRGGTMLTGEVLLMEPRLGHGDDAHPLMWEYYLVVDDGSPHELTAWITGSYQRPPCAAGDIVTIRVRRRTHHILALDVVTPAQWA